MSHIDLNQIDNMQYDVLREIGNIGAGNATTALSQMINAKIDMKVPNVELLEFKELSDIVGGAENLVVGILFTLEGQIDGMMMFMMDVDASRHLVNLLLGNTDENTSSEFTEMELSALNEIGNIIAGAYLSSLATLTNIVITSSVPYMAIDMAGAILSVPAIEFGKIGDKALLIETEFGDEIREVNGYFILIPTINSYGKILSSLGL
ncbi:chemotaxis protein CheC [Variimorphobacter saccharofermentans]|nr:chemotaxis protein CheC [Variimorphobacter saccharofermentans]